MFSSHHAILESSLKCRKANMYYSLSPPDINMKSIIVRHISSTALLAFVCSSFIAGEDNYYDALSSSSYDDDVEYIDSSQSTTTNVPSRGDNHFGSPKTEDTAPQIEIGKGRGRGNSFPRLPPDDFTHDTGDEDDIKNFDFGYGSFGASKFVEVRIGEFSATEPFARVYGKLTNYTGVFSSEVLQVSEFLGIPFAEAPINHLRFQRPILKTPPDELLALKHGQPCPQINSRGAVIGSEDCLHLSIYVPRASQFDGIAVDRRPRMPVLVWFHGENPEFIQQGKLSMLTTGSAEDLNPFVFLEKKMIVVTPQYRLSTLGFLSVANEDLNGNMGLLDEITALEWTQRYISYFDGDPNQITVMGQGSSAITLGLLSTTTSARSLFHRMILMSGSAASPLGLDHNQKLTYLDIARENHCPSFPTLQLVRCMQKKDVKSIVKADAKLAEGKHIGKLRSPLPVIQKEPDGRFLPTLVHEDPMTRIASGQFQDVPLIIGVTSSEMSGFLSSLSGRPAALLSSTLFTGSNVLRQFIRQVLGGSRSSWFGLDAESVSLLATFEYFAGLNITERQEQAQDLIEELLSDYLFNMPALAMANLWSHLSPVYFYVYDSVGPVEEMENFASSFRTGNGRRRQSGSGRNQPPSTFFTNSQAIHSSELHLLTQGYKGSAQDLELASIMLDVWSSFIHKGSPLQSGIEWPTYSEQSKEYLYFSERIQIRSNFRARQEQFWSGLLKELGEKSNCSSSHHGSKGRKVES